MEGFAAKHSFARAASSAFGGTDFSAVFDDPQLPPLRLRASHGGGGAAPSTPCSGSSDDDFVSMNSTPSGTGFLETERRCGSSISILA
jgi:hypothetical protein